MLRPGTFFGTAVSILLISVAQLPSQINDPNSGIQFKRGQDVVPAFEGWQRNTDGTYSFWFGYFNRNWEEQVDVPVGPNNKFEPGAIDQGQPTHFYTRRQFFAFKVIVSKDWPSDQKLVWTLITNGHMLRAKGWLQPEWEVNAGVMTENRNAGTPDLANEPPSITGSGPQSVTLPGTVTLTATATDDGRPLPKTQKRRGVESAPQPEKFDPIGTILPANMLRGQGLNIAWILWRGPGSVHFEPRSMKPAFEKQVKMDTTVSFTVPGTYVLRAIASDGALEAFHDVTVTVK